MFNLDGLTMFVSNTAGRSECDVERRLPGGRVRIVERFTWSTRATSGINVFDELPRA